MRTLAPILTILLVLTFGYTDSFAQPKKPPRPLKLKFQTADAVNLLWMIDQMSQWDPRSTSPSYRAYWNKKIGLTEEDLDMLGRYARLRQRLAGADAAQAVDALDLLGGEITTSSEKYFLTFLEMPSLANALKYLEVDPKDKRKALVKIITDAREHLRKYPASCAARERREKAFKALYMLNLSAFYKNKKETDKEYRKKEDYVFAQLVYEKSRTCCWNSSTAKMFEIIMDRVDTEEKAASTCAAPPVFMVKDDGYADFEAHAKTMGLKSYWQKWSADESCPQKYVVDDTEATHLWTPYCDLELFGKKYDAEPDTGDSGDGSDGGDGSDVF